MKIITAIIVVGFIPIYLQYSNMHCLTKSMFYNNNNHKITI